MIKSGLVQINKGYGIYPDQRAPHTFRNYSLTRPYVDSNFDTGFDNITPSDYQPSYIQSLVPTPKSVFKPKFELNLETINNATFGPTVYEDIFGKKHGDIINYVALRQSDGYYITPIDEEIYPVQEKSNLENSLAEISTEPLTIFKRSFNA